MWKQHIFELISFICGISLLVVGFLMFDYVHEKNNKVRSEKTHAQQETIQAAQKIETVLGKLSTVAHDIADNISSGKLRRENILKRLKVALKTTPNMFGIGVAFAPYVEHPQKRKLSPYYVNKDGKWEPKQDLIQVFTIPITYFDTAKQVEISIGVVFVDYLLSNVRSLMTELELGRTGYGFILSENGVFIAHPIEEYVKNNQTVFNLADSHHDDILRRLAEKAIDGASGTIDYIDQETGQSAWIFYQFVPSTNWSIGVVFFKDVLDTSSLRKKLIWICIATVIFLSLLAALVSRIDRGDRRGFWEYIVAFSIIIMGGIGFLWYLAQTAPFLEIAGSTTIVDKVGLERFLNIQTKQMSSKRPVYYIPTGIFVESMKFSGVNNITLSGYVWQKYSEDIPSTISRGFALPQAGYTDITESYHLKENNIELIGWHFQVVMRHEFYYAKYPFDKRQIGIRIAHRDFDKNVILIPDLEAYGVMNPAAKPGVKKELVLSGWAIFKSFFNYRINYENTNFGIVEFMGMGNINFPHLHINILLKREFIGQFISNVLPLIIISTILFGLQMWLGKTTTFMRSLIGLFFGILLAHIRLRGTIKTPEIIYLEFFYLVIYCSFLITTVSFFLYRYKVNIGYYRDGLIPKLLFWPIILISAFIITIVVFYDI
ncbi:cache domain-containing protein [Candidatus Halobeggiatoa sp. HSG11]|nr:cache domain-containing protein [Candidatus Halobeggiatoa sp. HSG11]